MAYHLKKFGFGLLTLAILGSGFASMICQLVWIKELQLLFGSYIVPVALVTALFLFGLALGWYFAGKLVDKLLNPGFLLMSALYLLALYVLLLLWSFPHLRTFYYQCSIHLYNKTLLLQLFRIFVALLVLLIPTVLMGTFLPLAAKIGIATTESVRNKTSLLFGMNTLGAAIGLLIAGFFILGKYGLHAAYNLAAFVYLINGLVLTALYMIFGMDSPPHQEVIKPQEKLRWPVGFILFVLFVDGFCMMGYELAWIRLLLNFSYEKTVYFITVIIASFIIVSGIGSIFLSFRTWKSKYVIDLLAWFPIAASLLTLVALIVFIWISPEWVGKRVSYVSWFDVFFNEYLPVLIFLIIPAIPMGMMMPAAAQVLAHELKTLGHKIGLIGWTNTAGSVAGSLLTGLVLIPALGVIRSFALLLIFNIFSGFLLLGFPRWKIILSGLIASLFLIFILPLRKVLPSLIQSYYPEEQLVAFREGLSATITVHRIPYGVEALSINGDKTAFTSIEDLKVHQTLAVLPMVYRPCYKNALVIGFGLGVTTGLLAEKKDAVVTVVDLSPEVFALADHFNEVNQYVTSKRNVNTVKDDGRSFLFHSEKKFDIITSNAVHPRLSSGLYTEEFYKLCNQNLTPGGVFCQWIPTNWLSLSEFKSLIRAFTNVFSHCSLWYITRSHTLLLATPYAADIKKERFRNLFSDELLAKSLQETDLIGSSSIASLFLIKDEDLRDMTLDAMTNLDNLPLIEYSHEIMMKPNPGILKNILEHISPISTLVFDDTMKSDEELWMKEVQSQQEQILKQIILYINAFRTDHP